MRTYAEGRLDRYRIVANALSKSVPITGILNSINSKDKLYKRLVQTPKGSPIYADLLSNFKVYKNIIRRSIMHAKRDYYRNVS